MFTYIYILYILFLSKGNDQDLFISRTNVFLLMYLIFIILFHWVTHSHIIINEPFFVVFQAVLLKHNYLCD